MVMTDSDNKHLEEQDYLDAPDEFETDIDDVADFDDGSDDDVFPIDDPKPKKKSNPRLIILIVLLALFGGAGAYFYTQLGSITPEPVPDIALATPEATPDNTVPAVPTPVSDFDQHIEEVPSVPETPPEVVVDQTTPPVVPDINSDQVPAVDALPVVDGQDNAAPVIDNQAGPKVIETPIVENNIEQAATNATPETVTSGPKVVETPIVEAEKPDDAALAPAEQKTASSNQALPVPKKKSELEKSRESINVKKEAVEPTVYFDSPKGKALLDIPPPSINPMLEPGESIIIVHKGGKPASTAIIEKGDESGFIESKLINAQRAAGLGFNDSALGFYNELYRKNPRDPRILMGRAVTLQKLGETQKAIDAYNEVLNVQPDNMDAITNLMGLIGKTQPAVALQNLLDLRTKYPRNALIAAQLGVAYSEAGNPQDGLKYLNAAAELQPKNPLHYYNMAVIYERLNDRANAIRYYEQALDIYSVNGSSAGESFSREQVYDRLSVLR